MSIDSGSNFELLTIEEVAEYFRVSVSAIRRLQQARVLPFVKIGGSLRFQRTDLESFLKQQRVESIDK
jgi:excisionase family DNA binding protein